MRKAAIVILAGLMAGPVSASEVISFEEMPAQNDGFVTLTEEYAHLGVHFASTDDGSTWDGMSVGDPGGWEVEGTNGPTFAGFNGRSYKLTVRFDATVPAFSLDVSAASGAPAAVPFALEGYRAGALVERNAITLGGLNQWTTVALTQEVDQVVMVSDLRIFHPFAVDNLHWGLDAPARLDVAIDVLPGNPENPVNPGSNGVLPVALLGADGFDVMEVDPDSLAVGVLGARAVSFKFEDVNGDGWADLSAHYRVPETGTAYGDTSLCLTGTTFDDVELAGCDVIRTVPKEPAAEKAAKARKK